MTTVEILKEMAFTATETQRRALEDWIYDKLGNAVNHELTLEFIHSGFDLSLVRPQESEDKK